MMKYEISERLAEHVQACEKLLEMKSIPYMKTWICDTTDEEFGADSCYAGILEFCDNFNQDIHISFEVCEDGAVYFCADGEKNGWTISFADREKWDFLYWYHRELHSARIVLEEIDHIEKACFISLRYRLPGTRPELMRFFSYMHLVLEAYEEFIDEVRDFCWEYEKLPAEIK